MAEMTLGGEPTKTRSMLVPILLALLVLAAAGGWFARTYVHASVTGSVDRVTLFPVHTEYKRGSGILVGQNQTEDAIYVLADVTLKDQSDVPLFLKTFNGSLTMDDGSTMEANVIDKNDLPRLFLMFPKLKTAADGTGSTPLLRESSVPKGGTGHGYIVMSYNVPQSVWDARKASDVSIDFYHQDRLTLPLPNRADRSGAP